MGGGGAFFILRTEKSRGLRSLDGGFSDVILQGIYEWEGGERMGKGV